MTLRLILTNIDIMETKQTSINHLLKQLATQLREVGLAPLGLKSTYKKLAECSKTVAQLENLGIPYNEAYDRAETLNKTLIA